MVQFFVIVDNTLLQKEGFFFSLLLKVELIFDTHGDSLEEEKKKS